MSTVPHTSTCIHTAEYLIYVDLRRGILAIVLTNWSLILHPNHHRLVLSDGKDTKATLCGHGQKKFAMKTNQLAATLRTNKKGSNKGFRCMVRSVGSSTSGMTAGHGNYATSDIPETTENPAATKPPATKPPTSGGKCKCSVSQPNRIVNGEEVSPAHKYPWHGGLKIKTNLNYWCGATIINNRYVLTRRPLLLRQARQPEP